MVISHGSCIISPTRKGEGCGANGSRREKKEREIFGNECWRGECAMGAGSGLGSPWPASFRVGLSCVGLAGAALQVMRIYLSFNAMRVYHFTLHAYRSWRADHPRGYVQHGEPGVRKANPKLAAHREAIATHGAVSFTDDQKSLILDVLPDTGARRTLRVHGACVTATHIHAVVSWADGRDAGDIEAGLKSGLGFVLSKAKGSTGNRWFSHGGQPEKVEDEIHFEHLLTVYLPEHLKEGGKVRICDLELKKPHPEG